MTTQKAQPSPVPSTFRVLILPGLEKVLVDQPNHTESVGYDGGIGEVLPNDVAIGLGQIHDHDLDVVPPR